MKRFLAGIGAALLSVAAFGTTLNPIQLLNPTGSASGQAIVSTGTSTVPIWGGVGVNGIAALAANTVLANATAGSASPTAFAMPSCSASASALTWTTSTGFTCNAALITAATAASTYATIAQATTALAATGGSINSVTVGATTPSTGAFTTLSASSTISGTGFSTYLASPPNIGTTTPAGGAFTSLGTTGLFSPSQTVGIAGTTTNNNAQAGSFGEYVTATASAVSLSNGTPANITSISLTAGDWDVSGAAAITAAGTTTVQNAFAGSSSTSATLGALGTFWNSFAGQSITAAAATYALPVVRYSLSATTTIFCVENVSFQVSTLTGSCLIRARRVR